MSRIRMVLAALAAIAFLFLRAIVPDFPISEEQLVEAVLLLFGAFIAGEAAEGYKSEIVSVLKSAKFRALVAGLLLVVLQAVWPSFPLTEADVAAVLQVLAVLIFGTGAGDGLKRLLAQ